MQPKEAVLGRQAARPLDYSAPLLANNWAELPKCVPTGVLKESGRARVNRTKEARSSALRGPSHDCQVRRLRHIESAPEWSLRRPLRLRCGKCKRDFISDVPVPPVVPPPPPPVVTPHVLSVLRERTAPTRLDKQAHQPIEQGDAPETPPTKNAPATPPTKSASTGDWIVWLVVLALVGVGIWENLPTETTKAVSAFFTVTPAVKRPSTEQRLLRQLEQLEQNQQEQLERQQEQLDQLEELRRRQMWQEFDQRNRDWEQRRRQRYP